MQGAHLAETELIDAPHPDSMSLSSTGAHQSWNIARAHWADMDKASQADQKTLDKAVASGTIVG